MNRLGRSDAGILILLLCIFGWLPAHADNVTVTKDRAREGFRPNEAITIRHGPAAAMNDLKCDKVFESVSATDNFIKLADVQLRGAIMGRDFREPMKELSKQMVWIPVWLEEYFAEKIHAQMVENGEIIDSPMRNLPKKQLAQFKAADEILNGIVGNLPADHGYIFRLYVSSEDGVNAKAMPGGYLYINRAALNKDKDFLALMLAHEVAHVTKRHVVKELQVMLVDSVDTFSDIKAVLGKDSQAMGKMLGKVLATKKLLEQFGQNQEHEADACAIRLLANQPGINVNRGIGSFLAEIGKDNRAKGSHPSYPNRQSLMMSANVNYKNKQYVGERQQDAESRDQASPALEGEEKNRQLSENRTEGDGASLLGTFGSGIKALFGGTNAITPEGVGNSPK